MISAMDFPRDFGGSVDQTCPVVPDPPPWPSGARLSCRDVECCRRARDADPLGRYPIGYCGPECLRRPRPLRSTAPTQGET